MGQASRALKKGKGVAGGGRDEQVEHREVRVVHLLCMVPFVVGTCHYMCVQTHRLNSGKSES